MKFLELVQRRQSTRKFFPGKQIPREILERCLEAARLAPSACNSQPWSFVIVDDPEQVRALALAACGHAPYGMNKFTQDASAFVAVITEKMNFAARIGAFFRGVQYCLIDVGIACSHLLLQAEEDGVASCWLGWFDEKALKKQLNIPSGKKVDNLLCLGYAADPTLRPKNRHPLDQIRRYL